MAKEVSTATKAVVTLIAGLLVGFMLPKLWEAGNLGVRSAVAQDRNYATIQKLEEKVEQHSDELAEGKRYTREDADEDWSEHGEVHEATNERLAAMEGKLDLLIEITMKTHEQQESKKE